MTVFYDACWRLLCRVRAPGDSSGFLVPSCPLNVQSRIQCIVASSEAVRATTSANLSLLVSLFFKSSALCFQVFQDGGKGVVINVPCLFLAVCGALLTFSASPSLSSLLISLLPWLCMVWRVLKLCSCPGSDQITGDCVFEMWKNVFDTICSLEVWQH